MPEVHARSYLLGEHVGATYLPSRVVSFTAGRAYSGYQFDAAGRQIAVRTATFAQTSTAPSDRRAVINGRVYHRITAGTFAGYWIGASVLVIDG